MSSYIKVGTVGNTDWQRPTDWLPMPSIGENEEIFVGLHAVWDTTANPCALLCNGTGSGYSVDWGDGTTTNHTFNTKAEYNYDYSSISSDESERGYKMVVIKITPQSGAAITLLNLQQRHTSYNYAYKTGLLEYRMNFSNCTMTSNYSYLVVHSFIEYVYIKKFIPSNIYAFFNGHFALTKIEIKEPLPANCNDFLRFSASGISIFYNLRYFIVDMSNVTSSAYMFHGSPYIEDLSSYSISSFINTTIYPMEGLKKFPIITNSPTNISYLAYNKPFTSILPSIDCVNVTDASFLCPSIGRCIVKSLLYNIKVTHSYVNQLLDAASLNEIYTNLGTANSGATLTITGNQGAGASDTSIATSKGWTIIN